MKREIRQAILSDASSYIEIKNELAVITQEDDKTTSSGGFLLGTDFETYQSYIDLGFCLTALSDYKVVGFGVILPNEMVKTSELWIKRKQVSWLIDIQELETQNISYIDQLAFLKGNSRLAVLLAYNMIKHAFETGANFVLTTTVKEPINNLAAVPFIKAAGGKTVGTIDEVYPVIGDIKSDIHLISAEVFLKQFVNFQCITGFKTMKFK